MICRLTPAARRGCGGRWQTVDRRLAPCRSLAYATFIVPSSPASQDLLPAAWVFEVAGRLRGEGCVGGAGNVWPEASAFRSLRCATFRRIWPMGISVDGVSSTLPIVPLT